VRDRKNRQLSVEDIWASLDPIIWSVTQPISAQLLGIQLVDFKADRVDLTDLDTVSFDIGIITRVSVVVRSSFDVDLELTKLSLDCAFGNLSTAGSAFATINLDPFRFQTAVQNTTNNKVTATMRNITAIAEVAKSAIDGNKNITLVLIGRHNEDPSLLSRIVSHMRAAINVVSTPEAPVENTTASASKEDDSKVVVKASIQNQPDLFYIGAEVILPADVNPLVFTFSMGDMSLTFSHNDLVIGRAAVKGFAVMDEQDVFLSSQVMVDATGIGPLLSIVRRLKSGRGFNILIRGTINDRKYPGKVYANIVIPDSLIQKSFTWDNSDTGALRFSVSDLTSAFGDLATVNSVDIIGGDSIGSTINLPCILKGWCKWHTSPTPFTAKLRVNAAIDLQGYLPEIVVIEISTPKIPAEVTVKEVHSGTLGKVVLEPFTLQITQKGIHAVDATFTSYNNQGIQQLSYLLWESPITVMVDVTEQDGDILGAVMSQLPIQVDWPPPPPEKQVKTLLTLPTFCDKRWTLQSTNEDSFSASVSLPGPLSLPIPIIMEQFKAQLFYEGTPVLQLTTPDGRFFLGPDGGTSTIIITSLVDQSVKGGKFNKPVQCNYPSRYPDKCILGVALGKMLSLGDAGELVLDAAISFANRAGDGLQTVRMPLSLYNGAEMRPTFTDGSNTPMRCAHANELIQDIDLQIGDIIANNLRFWNGVNLYMKILTRNFYAFDISLNRVILNMNFRDPDGAPSHDEPRIIIYPPQETVVMLKDAEVNMENVMVPSGQTNWSPTVKPPLNPSTMAESIARLSDEILVNHRLCAELDQSIFGLTLRKDNSSVPFNIDLVVSIKDISLYDHHACEVSMRAKSKEQTFVSSSSSTSSSSSSSSNSEDLASSRSSSSIASEAVMPTISEPPESSAGAVDIAQERAASKEIDSSGNVS